MSVATVVCEIRINKSMLWEKNLVFANEEKLGLTLKRCGKSWSVISYSSVNRSNVLDGISVSFFTHFIDR